MNLAVSSGAAHAVLLDALSAHAVHLAAGAGGTILNTAGIQSILAGVFGVVILALGVRAGFHAHRSNYAAVLAMIGILGLAAMIWSVASGGQITKLGGDLVGHVLNL